MKSGCPLLSHPIKIRLFLSSWTKTETQSLPQKEQRDTFRKEEKGGGRRSTVMHPSQKPKRLRVSGTPALGSLLPIRKYNKDELNFNFQ